MDLGVESLGRQAVKRLPYAKRGYLLVLVAVCVSLLSISFLRLAASSARSDDESEGEVAEMAALYAAESGLVAAELKFRNLQNPPPAGQWFVGSLRSSGARYEVDVQAGAVKNQFSVLCKGQIDGEGDRKYTCVLQAEVVRAPSKVWTVSRRKRQ